jgi:transposase
LSTKIHAVVDAHGLPVRLVLTPGQASDKTTFPRLIEGLRLARDVVADRGFFARAIIDLIEAGGATAHIPRKAMFGSGAWSIRRSTVSAISSSASSTSSNTSVASPPDSTS